MMEQKRALPVPGRWLLLEEGADGAAPLPEIDVELQVRNRFHHLDGLPRVVQSGSRAGAAVPARRMREIGREMDAGPKRVRGREERARARKRERE